MNLVSILVLSLAGHSLCGVISHNDYASAAELEDSSGADYEHQEESPVKVIKITRTYAVPVPYPVPYTKEVPVPIPVHKVVPYPVPVPVHKPVVIPHPVAVAVPVHAAAHSNHQYYVTTNVGDGYSGQGYASDAEEQLHYNHLQHSHAQVVHHD